MQSIRFLLGASLLAMLCGCPAKHAETTTNDSSIAHSEGQAKTEGVLSNAQQQTLEKAKRVEELLQETQEKNLRKVDEMTEGGD